jgi:hypothetical protein
MVRCVSLGEVSPTCSVRDQHLAPGQPAISAVNKVAHPPAGLFLAEPAPDTSDEQLDGFAPSVGVRAGGRGGRLIFTGRRMAAVIAGGLVAGYATPAPTIGCRPNQSDLLIQIGLEGSCGVGVRLTCSARMSVQWDRWWGPARTAATLMCSRRCDALCGKGR